MRPSWTRPDRIAALLLAAAFAVLCASVADALRIAPLPAARAGRDVARAAEAAVAAPGPVAHADPAGGAAADVGVVDAGALEADVASAAGVSGDAAEATVADAHVAAADVADGDAADANAAGRNATRTAATRSRAARAAATRGDAAAGSGAPSVRDVERATRAVLAAVARDPFRPDRRRAPDRYRLPGEALAVEPVARRAPLPPLRLVGTASFGDGRGFAALMVQGRTPLLVPVGDTLGGLRLLRVDTGSAVLEAADTVVLLEVARRLDGRVRR
ncbi:MAG TPA: hypothetical protein VF192_00105 [Longimicrobiales bacterium]